MSSVYFMRHGDVENPESVWYGNLPGFPLSTRGREQIRRAAEALKALDPHIAAIICSPRMRTKQSADIAASVLGVQDVSQDDSLREWQTDEWEGSSFDHIVNDSGYYAKPLRIPWNEKLDDLAHRVKAAVDHARLKNFNKNILIVGHREPLVAYLMSATNQPWEKIHEFDMPRAAVWRAEYDHDNRIEKMEKLA